MLSSINLQSTDFTAFTGDPAADAQVSLDADTPAAGFAELLNQPVPTDDPTGDSEADSVEVPEAGEELPNDGNILPSDASELLPLPEQVAGQPTRGDGVPLGAPEGELPIVRMVPPNELTNQVTLPINPEAQVAAASAAARPEQGQRAGVYTGAASVAAELRSLLTLPASQIPRSTDNQAMANQAGQNIGDTRRAASLDGIENAIRPVSTLDPQAAMEGQRTIPISSHDALAGLIERWQGPASTQSFGTIPQPIAFVPALTAGAHAPLAPAASAALPLPAPIDIPLQNAAWGDALSDRVMFMTSQKIHNAEIRLNPAQLGPITITVTVDDSAADVTFTAQHAAARDAIELAMPRLREMLSENGLQLGNASVAERGVDKDANGGEAQEARGWNDIADDGLPNNEVEQVGPLRMPQGLVDTFV